MGIRERQERDREAVRRAILDAARELFVSEGYQNVSIRKIAERIEYSPAAIYGYFPSKDDIFFALAEEGFRLLCNSGASIDKPGNSGAIDQVRGIFWRFYRFSREHPQYFALMFVDRSVPRISREYERFAFARELKTQAISRVQQCIDDGILPAKVPAQVTVRMLTTALLGIAVLHLSDRLGPGENADALAMDVLDVTIAGLQADVALRSTADEPQAAPFGAKAS